MAIQTSTIVDALDANLNMMHQDGLRHWGPEVDKVFNVGNSTKQSEKDSYESGFKIMPEKAEGVAADFDVIMPGISKNYVHVTYALGYEITEEAIEDNLRTPETFNKLPQALARSGIETVETVSFNVFNNGFSTNGFDGVPLFSASHPMLDGTTQGNTPSAQVDLSVTSLTAAITAVEKYTDERSLKQPTKATMLLIAVDNWNVAEELLGSEFKPFTANNEVNALRIRDMSYFVGHYLSDTDAWFILAEKSGHFLKFFWRVRMGALRRGTDFDSTNLKHLQRMRFSVGHSRWDGTYGSSGG